jgi:hypothetical protein
MVEGGCRVPPNVQPPCAQGATPNSEHNIYNIALHSTTLISIELPVIVEGGCRVFPSVPPPCAHGAPVIDTGPRVRCKSEAVGTRGAPPIPNIIYKRGPVWSMRFGGGVV